MAFEITDLTPQNIDEGVFCYMSKRKTVGYARKLAWEEKRLAERMHIRFCNSGGGRGFIEYIPGEYAWRAVNAPGYMVIHCIWNVRKNRGNGLSQLKTFIRYKASMKGIIVIKVDPRYTSQTYPEWDWVDEHNRPERSTFCCVACGHSATADTVAAVNIAARAAVNWLMVSSLPGSGTIPRQLAAR